MSESVAISCLGDSWQRPIGCWLNSTICSWAPGTCSETTVLKLAYAVRCNIIWYFVVIFSGHTDVKWRFTITLGFLILQYLLYHIALYLFVIVCVSIFAH